MTVVAVVTHIFVGVSSKQVKLLNRYPLNAELVLMIKTYERSALMNYSTATIADGQSSGHQPNPTSKLDQVLAATDYPIQPSSQSDWVTGLFYHCKLSSAFQPIFDVIENKTIGHAAYARSESNGEAALSPWNIFALASEVEQLVKLDRLCRTVHAINYFNSSAKSDTKLFLNVQPRLLESVKDDHGKAFEYILSLIDEPTSRIVIEIPSEVNRDWKLLKHVIHNYRSRGYQIAINYNRSNRDWILELLIELGGFYPNIVRIRVTDLLKQNAVTPLIKTIHQFGAIVLAYDIETATQAADAIYAGVDYLQGNFLGKPSQAIQPVTVQIMKEILYPELAGTII